MKQLANVECQECLKECVWRIGSEAVRANVQSADYIRDQINLVGHNNSPPIRGKSLLSAVCAIYLQ